MRTQSRLLWTLLLALFLAPHVVQAGCEPVPPIQRDIETERLFLDSRSTMAVPNAAEDNLAKLANLDQFLDLIAHDSDTYVTSGDKNARTCALAALDIWSRGNALSGDMNDKGRSARVWATGTIALVLIKLNAAPSGATRTWMEWLCDTARQDEQARMGRFRMNNLAYWGAVDIGSCGIVLGRKDYWQFADQIMHEGIAQIRDDGTLQREMNRGQRATHYHDFAAQPLVTLMRLSAWQSAPISADEHARLEKLVNLVIAAGNDPQLLAQTTGTRQKRFEMPGWFVLWNGTQPAGNDAHGAYYIKLGGDTRALNTVLSKKMH